MGGQFLYLRISRGFGVISGIAVGHIGRGRFPSCGIGVVAVDRLSGEPQGSGDLRGVSAGVGLNGHPVIRVVQAQARQAPGTGGDRGAADEDQAIRISIQVGEDIHDRAVGFGAGTVHLRQAHVSNRRGDNVLVVARPAELNSNPGVVVDQVSPPGVVVTLAGNSDAQARIVSNEILLPRGGRSNGIRGGTEADRDPIRAISKVGSSSDVRADVVALDHVAV